MNTSLINRNRFFLAIYGLYFLVFASISSTAQAWAPVTDLDKFILQKYGYSTDTPEQVIVATKSESYAVRFMALELLTDYIGKDAIPVLKQFLNDPHITVRWRTAHLLGTLGDKSGLKQMQTDFEKLTAKAATPLPTDPNLDPDTRERIENERNIALHDALGVAKVLVELDDRRGYKLAARMALAGLRTYHRSDAARVLVEIAKSETNILSAEGIDPIFILCKMAESEKDPIVFKTLIYSVYKLDDDKKVHILEKAKNSPNQPKAIRREAQLALDGIEARKKAAEIQAKDPNSCCN